MTDAARMHQDLGDGLDLAGLLALVRRIEAQSERLVSGVMAGGYQSVFRGSGIEFDTIRDYVEGDDPRSVDHAVTARMGRPFVRTYVEERDLTMHLLLDLSASMVEGGFAAWSVRQTAARIAACLALSATHNDDKVGLLAFAARIEKVVPAGKGMRHVLRIVRDCLALPGSTARTDVAGALEFAARSTRRHAVVFVLSDFLDVGSDPERFRRALQLCARHHDVVAVRVLAPELDAELLHREGAGLLDTIDPETGRRATIDFGSAVVRRDYAARIAAWRDWIDGLLRRARVDVMDVPVPRVPDDNAIAGPILRLFAARQRRGARR
ncbi:MAG: DUF58 domain-containing protein [Planctomycetes bacterium]|nr:DUF58 domain-containing protein [Planctomycetota bacterium]